MLRVGLTGGVACGKTTVAQMLRERGAYTLLADKLAHDLMRPGEAVYARVVECFGSGILNQDGSISRPKLAELAFAGRIQELNAIVHPAVLEAEDRWMEEMGRRDPAAIAVCEAALLYEAGGDRRFDRIIVVTCPSTPASCQGGNENAVLGRHRQGCSRRDHAGGSLAGGETDRV